jgi:SNF2 family DNA or RNA helicase
MNPYIPAAIVGWRDTDKLQALVNPYIFNLRKEDFAKDLPEMSETNLLIERTEREKTIYNRIKSELLVEIKGTDMPVANAIVKLIRLRQAANGLFAFGEEKTSSKLDALLELLALNPSEQALIFTEFAETAKELGKRLPSSGLIIGETPIANRHTLTSAFQSGELNYLIGTSAMATGLNLQNASIVVNIDLPWSCAKYEQRIGRAWRMGQKQNVRVFNLLALQTVDEYVHNILKTKQTVAEDFARLTLKDIEALLA